MMHSFDFVVMNFIDSFRRTTKEKRYIFHFMNYFFRFSISIVIKIADVSDVIRCLRKMFQKYRRSIEIYCDHEQHFDNEKLKEFLKQKNVKIIYSSSEASKSIDMIEINNKLLQNVLKKIVVENEWNLSLFASTKSLNCHQIRHLELSFQNILLDSETSMLAMKSKFLISSNNESVENIIAAVNDFKIQNEIIRNYFLHRIETHDSIKVKSDARKKKKMTKYDREITQNIHEINFLTMIYQKDIKKLQFKWKKLFKIIEYDESHQISFILTQLNDRKIRDNFHDDHLKIYRFRTEYLNDSLHSNEELIIYQTIRQFKNKKERFNKQAFWELKNEWRWKKLRKTMLRWCFDCFSW